MSVEPKTQKPERLLSREDFLQYHQNLKERLELGIITQSVFKDLSIDAWDYEKFVFKEGSYAPKKSCCNCNCGKE